MRVTVKCDRCGATVEGWQTEDATGGFYNVSGDYWSRFANDGEAVVCDSCMWVDPRYREAYSFRLTT